MVKCARVLRCDEGRGAGPSHTPVDAFEAFHDIVDGQATGTKCMYAVRSTPYLANDLCAGLQSGTPVHR